MHSYVTTSSAGGLRELIPSGLWLTGGARNEGRSTPFQSTETTSSPDVTSFAPAAAEVCAVTSDGPVSTSKASGIIIESFFVMANKSSHPAGEAVESSSSPF